MLVLLLLVKDLGLVVVVIKWKLQDLLYIRLKIKIQGPGTYELKSTVVEDVVTYSLGAKPDHVDHKINVPGPGSCNFNLYL